MKLKVAILLMIAASVMTGCNGMFGDIYDDIPSDGGSADGFSTSPTHPDCLTLRIDASDFGKWHYVSLKNKSVEERPIPLACEGEWDGRSGITLNQVRGDEYTPLSATATDAQSEPAEWDFAIHRFDVRTNGGAAAVTSFTSLDDIDSTDLASLPFVADEWSTSTVMVDLTDMMAYRIGYQNIYVNPVLSGWVKMDISTPPPTYEATGRVYLMRLGDGSLAAMRLRSYVNESGVKGHLTIDIIYPWR